MRPRAQTAAALAVATVSAAATFTIAATGHQRRTTADWGTFKTCLDVAPGTIGTITNRADLDYLAQTATHALATKVYGNYVSVMQGGDIEKPAAMFAAGDELQLTHGLVAIWDDPPKDYETRLIERCASAAS